MCKVIVAKTYEEAQVVSEKLINLSSTLYGFDTETTIGREDNRFPSLIQISTNDECYLIQIYRIWSVTKQFPSKLKKFLKNNQLIKVGVGITRDVEMLTHYDVKINGCVDIQHIAITMEVPVTSLKDLATIYCPDYPGKTKYITNVDWDKDLDTEAIRYAVNDAVYSLKIYQRMVLKNDDVIRRSRPIDTKIIDDWYINWVITNIESNAYHQRRYNSLIAQTVNSYGPWSRLFTRSERENKAKANLDFLKDNKVLVYNPVNDCLRLASPDVTKDN